MILSRGELELDEAYFLAIIIFVGKKGAKEIIFVIYIQTDGQYSLSL